MLGRRSLGYGIGLRAVHFEDVLAASEPVVDWFEIISEDFLVAGGNPRRVLRAVRERYPIAMHGVSLSLGSTDPLDEQYLSALARLAEEIEPEWVSDHLCWTTFGGHSTHDLLPLPFTEEALAHVTERVLRVQERLNRPLVIENVSSYATFTSSTLTEWDFLAELSRRTDSLLLLDVNNVFVSAHNHGFDARTFLDGIPAERVRQIHLAGHTESGDLLLDTHDQPVTDAVWDLYASAIRRCGPVSTLVEWDGDIPPLACVALEAARARSVAEAALV